VTVGSSSAKTGRSKINPDRYIKTEQVDRIAGGHPDMGNNGAATQTSVQADTAVFRIGEVSRMTGVKAFVLRFWETEFPMLEPEKGANGRRLYTQEDVDLIRKIKRLLYDEGFTIAGARRHLREGGGAADENGNLAPGYGAQQLLSRKLLLDMRDSLRAFLSLLERR
jgi:DNA-binding transcriptional MerR regulator